MTVEQNVLLLMIKSALACYTDMQNGLKFQNNDHSLKLDL